MKSQSKIANMTNALSNDIQEELSLLAKIPLESYVEQFAELLKPSKLRLSVVKIDFGINLNRAATTYKFAYNKDQVQYVQGNWPEKCVEFDIEGATDDSELEITVQYRENPANPEETVDLGSVKF